MADASIYTVGGTVQTNRSGVYISRQADEELLALCRDGKFAYVLTPRQMGKSSLMVRTARQLRTEGIESVMIDLTGIGTQVTNPEQWYLGLLIQIEAQLMLDTDVYSWWQAHAHLGFTQRLTEFFQRVLLVEITASVVIFIDEIDTTLRLDFTDDFYAAIRYLYVSRASLSSEFERLSFVLFGVATPGDLIRDPKRTPFNVGQRVDLTDFTLTEAEPLAKGLGLPTPKAQQVLHWVLDWTGGHPYLSQRICSILSQQDKKNWSKADIDRIVSRNFFGARSEEDNNLQFVRDMLTKRAPDKAAVLSIYREIRRGKRAVADEEQSITKSHLKLSGVVKRKNGVLKVRNPIYQRVFDLKWVNQHLPLNLRDFWQRYKPALPYVAILLIFSIFMGGMAFYANTQRLDAEAQRLHTEKALKNSQVLVQSLTTENLFTSGYELEALLEGLKAGKNLKQYGDAVDSDNRTKAILALREVVYGLKERNRLEGHSSYVTSVVFSPDGKTLASGSRDNTVKLWNLNGQLQHTLKGHSSYVTSVVFSPDGKTLASGS
ncbi:AAA-like domain-containing protein, partial [Brasilonema bromeliae]